MPTYEYKCDKCGDMFEEYQSINADPLTKCKKPDCGGTVHRLISPGAGFLFKGSGFYSTDYRSDSYKKGATADTSSTSKASSTDSGKKSEGGAKPSASSSETK
jgi:putative FmdB family regulatory protein